jgi:lipopolysaccharide cholinephosphotransferase
MAQAFDRICRKHRIPYYMLGGTMLGAVRHQGFIPWDDDMDFGVPRADFSRLADILSEELPAHMRILTFGKGNLVFSNFMKMDNTRTLIVDSSHDKTSGLGINIDIFPLDDGRKTRPGTRLLVSCVLFLLQIKDYLYFDPDQIRKGIKKWIAKLLRRFCPVRIDQLLKYIERCICKYSVHDSAFYINFYGVWRLREMMPKHYFGTPKEYPFEQIRLWGVTHPDAYLSRLYGNYMQLPPEDKRAVHIMEMYYRDPDGT